MLKKDASFEFVNFGTLSFKILYLFLTLLSFNSFTARTHYMVYSSFFVTAIGALMLLYRLKNYKNFIKTKNLYWLIMFCASYALAAILNIKYGILENIQGLIWMSLQFFLLYACDVTRKQDDYRKEFKLIAYIFLIYVEVCAVCSLIMLMIGYSHARNVGNELLVISGFMWGRLWGVYSDPNYGAVFSCISIILSFSFMKNQVTWLRALYIFNIICQVFYIAFSDSRTGILSLMFSMGVYSYFTLLRNNTIQKRNLNIAARQLVCVLLAIFISVGFLATNKLIKNAINSEYFARRNIKIYNTKWYMIGRDNDIKNDISNRRFGIWKSGIEIFCTRPIVGVSFRNILPYTKDVLPKTYIVNNDFVMFSSLHNTIIDVLVSQGIIGIIILAGFAVSTLTFLFRRTRRLNNENYPYVVTLFCAILPVVVSMAVYSEVLYINTAGSFIFWSFLGYLIHFVSKIKVEDSEIISSSMFKS